MRDLRGTVNVLCDVKIWRWQQTLRMPNAWNTLQLIELIPAVIKANRFDFCELVSIVQLLVLQFTVIFPVAQKLLQHQA